MGCLDPGVLRGERRRGHEVALRIVLDIAERDQTPARSPRPHHDAGVVEGARAGGAHGGRAPRDEPHVADDHRRSAGRHLSVDACGGQRSRGRFVRVHQCRRRHPRGFNPRGAQHLGDRAVVVGVRVGEHQQVDGVHPVPAQAFGSSRLRRPDVDHRDGTGGPHEHRVALADVARDDRPVGGHWRRQG